MANQRRISCGGVGAESWEINHRISTVSFDPADARLVGLIEEFIGIAAVQGNVQLVWTDTRNLNQDVFSARIRVHCVPADANGDCAVNASDITYLVRFFKGLGTAPFIGDCRR